MARKRRRYAHALGVLAVALLVGSGCSYVLDTDGYADAERLVGDSSTSADGATDGTSDGGVSPDATAEATADVSSRACVPDAHAFCASFDEPPFTREWQQFSAGIASFSLSDAASTTAPSSLVIAGQWDASGNGGYLASTFDRIFSSIRCELDVRRDVIGPGRLPVAHLVVEGEFGRVDITFDETETGRRLSQFEGFVDGGDRRNTLGASATATGVWARMGLEISLASQAVALTEEGNPVAQGTLVVAGQANKFTFLVGAEDVGPPAGGGAAGPWAVRLDSVVCDVAGP